MKKEDKSHNYIIRVLNIIKDFFGKILKAILKYQKYSIPIIFVLIFGYISYKYYQNIEVLKDPLKIKSIILSYGKNSVLVYILFQIIQVVVFFIPGEIVQIAGGYVFGTFYGGILSFIGIGIGSALVFFISDYFGREFVREFIAKKKFKKVNKLIKNSSKKMVVFFLYLIPGIPKDILAYTCGVSTDVNFKTFIIYSSLGRIPGIFMSTYFGDKIGKKETETLMVISVVMVTLFLIGTLRGEKIIKKISKGKEKKED